MDFEIPKRSALWTIFLSAALVFIVVKIIISWREGPWDLPQPPAVATPALAAQAEAPAAPPRMAATDIVIGKNLFDPERGATQTKETETTNRALQRIRSLVLMGTAILGESRYALIHESGAQPGGRPSQGQSNQSMRFKMGDIFEGFSLSQIQDKTVVFTNGAMRVELALDFFRKVEVAAPAVPSAPRPAATRVPPGAAPSPTAPRVVPQLPRRERLPQPPPS